MNRNSKTAAGNVMAGVFNKLLAIQIFSVIVATIGSFIDGVVTSNFLGREAMAAFGIVTPVYVIFSCVSNLMGNGAQTICGQAVGRGDGQRVNGIFTLTMVSVTVVGAASMLLSFAFSGPIARLLGATGDSAVMAADYIRGLSFGAIAIMINGPIMRFLQLDKASKLSFRGVLVMTCVNICGDLLNVFVFKKGMFGMAVATSVSYYASLLALCPHFFRKEASIHLERASMRLGELKEILTIGLPTAVGQLCNVLRSLCLNRIFMALAGTLFVAAYSGQNTVSTLINSIGIGVGMTSLLICSVLVGEQDRTSLTQTMKANLKTAVFLNTCIAALVFVGADLLASLFGKGDPETRRLSAYILRVYACGLPFSIVSTVFQNFFQSMKKMKLVNVICVCQNFLFMVGYALLLPAVFGKNAVWLIFPLTHLTAVLLILGVSTVHNRRFPRSMEQLLMLDKQFGIPEENRMDLSITSMEQVMGTAQEAESFCLSHGIDGRRSQACSLALEEMAGNIVRHGFGDGKRHSIDVRLSCKEDKLILRLKDDCKPFNPKQQLAMVDPNDKEHNIGIRLVAGLAKRMTYQNTFRLNILIIEL